MPSWMMTPISSTLYSAARAVGLPNFCFWLNEALDHGVGAPSGWREMQPPESRLTALFAVPGSHLGSGTDIQVSDREFKKRLKVLCGGKKKGELGRPPPRSR
mmetsp:Transcript_6206/g.14910  ORF Transcript_6206/g.14910 Transcript_6206/m.14910 type:complete len:102 (+) Transcript_6206:3-308(+)